MHFISFLIRKVQKGVLNDMGSVNVFHRAESPKTKSTYSGHTVSYHSEYNIPQFRLAVKRLMDIAASSILILILLPLMPIIGLAIVIDSPGGVFFKQKRLGKDMNLFTIYKFRTMSLDAKKHKRAEVFSGKDARLTRVGRFLRRTKLDELPQIINIFKGDMSLVGPRPMLPYHKKHYKGYKRDRFAVRPGLTGLAQVSGGVFIPLADRAEYDVDYVRDFSIPLDIKILFKTLIIIFAGERRFIRSYRQAEAEAAASSMRITAGEKKESIA